ncbi:sodium:solute symporter family protein [Geitlerinema sp. PCC 9228]|jgi:Na+/proline symporter|uniref:sodium:solute symporter family protein n=1 Tax=Geitlerinema sp. PCC 9228 TaxID=111611 RepID=UPI0008F99A03|nr:sodium:solute symporter family protein [Geitlerinema sp. PCC 9228]
MTILDWSICLVYIGFSLLLGFLLSRRGGKSLEEFFVSGRSLSWWLAGTSMAATTFSIDTPLYIAGVVGDRGIAGNWEWWNFAIAHIIMIYIFARLWRRSQVVTDAELTELRYGGRGAAWLRGVKAFLFAVPINCIGIGYAMLAMVKVVDALEIWSSLGIEPGQQVKLLSTIGVSLLVLLYTSFAGLWGVVVTDFFQFFLGLLGAIAVAVVSVNSVGGMETLIAQVQTNTPADTLSFFPLSWDTSGIRWQETAGITASSFFAYTFVQWWSFRRSDGGGEFIQRLISTKDEVEAEKAAWFFNILHYIVRTWPWIVVALAAIAVYPELSDRELGYPKLMLEFLPPGLLGLVAASLLAAFMSTVSTSINWGASYLTNDIYLRFLNPNASQLQLVAVGRLASVLVTVLGATAAFFSESVAMVFQLVIAIGTGPGLVLILRWFWWRINAMAELTSMLAGFVVGFSTSVVPILQIDDFGWRLVVTSAVTAAIWIPAMLLTPPEDDDTLNRFYARVRPPGFWQRQAKATGIESEGDLLRNVKQAIAALFLLFGVMFGIGGFLLLQPFAGWMFAMIAGVGWMWLQRLRKSRVAPTPRPGLSDRDVSDAEKW